MKKGGFIKLGIGATILLFAFLYPTITAELLLESLFEEGEEAILVWWLILEAIFTAGGVLLALGLKDFYRRKGLAFLMIPAFALVCTPYVYFWFTGAVEDKLGFLGSIILEESGLTEAEPALIILFIMALGLIALSCALGFTGRKPEPVAAAPAPAAAPIPASAPTCAPAPAAAPVAAPSVRYCEICGKEINEGFKFCEGCGAPIVAPMEEAASAPAPAEAPRLKSTFTSSGAGPASSGSTSAPSTDRNFRAAGDL